MVFSFAAAYSENLYHYPCHRLWHGACVVHAAKGIACAFITDVNDIRYCINIERVRVSAMQIVVWKSPKALSSILMAVFGIKKRND